MNQEKIAEFIKKIRRSNNLTQKEFANKYNISPQAVSKWEKGINMPDIVLLKKISEDYNVSLDDILDGNFKNKSKRNKLWIVISVIVFIILTFIIMLLFLKNNNDFEFKPLSTTCSNFRITGSIAYNQNKSSIYISNIDYCGKEDNTEYKSVDCTLYEKNGSVITKVSSYSYKSEEESIKLDDFFNEVILNIDNFNKTCKNYTNDSLYLQVDATDKFDNITSYKIPLSFAEKCD